MILRFTDKEVDLLKEALSVYTQTLSERGRLLSPPVYHSLPDIRSL